MALSGKKAIKCTKQYKKTKKIRLFFVNKQNHRAWVPVITLLPRY